MKKTVRIFSLFALLWIGSACTRTTPGVGSDPTINTVGTTSPDLQLVVTSQVNTELKSVSYRYEVRNMGPSVFSGPVAIIDDRVQANCGAINQVGNQDEKLDPNESGILCEGTYSFTQADLDAGKVVSRSRVSVEGGKFISNEVVTEVILVANRELILKTKSDRASYDQVGQTITLTYEIVNNGNVSLGPVQFTVNDALLGAPLNCGPAASSLKPGESILCSAVYLVTQADLGNISLTSNATASDGTTTSAATQVVLTRSGSAQPPTSGLTAGTTIRHTVISGDWLLQIARCYGADYESLRSSNPQIGNPAMIWPGQVVSVPNIGSAGKIYGPPCVVFHTAVAGDTWASLGAKYNARLDSLQEVNPGGLYPGATIKVPINSAGESSSQVPATKRISFQTGATSATESGTLTAFGKITYLVAASQGQTMTVTLTALAGEVAMGIVDPVGTTLLNPGNLALSWSGTLPVNGDYRIELASAAGITDKNYSLKVELTTPSATLERVADIRPGPDSSGPESLAVYKGALYFGADGGDGAGYELWKYDGTSASRVADIREGPDDSGVYFLTVYNGALYFSADGGDGAGNELWKSDGSSAKRVSDIRPGLDNSWPADLAVYNDALYFRASDGNGTGVALWKYDGTSASLVPILNAGLSSILSQLEVYNGALYFGALDGGITGFELWKYDGTSASLVADILPGPFDSEPGNLVVYNGALYFWADGGDGAGYELWKYDGTSASRVADIRPGSDSSLPASLVVYKGALYFAADGGDGAGYELWKYDGTSASRVADIREGSAGSNPGDLVVYNGALYFSADSGDGAGNELWRYISPSP